MSYHVYTTEGIILKRNTFGEANIFLHILTKDLGLIIASAHSARLSLSKLRPALQEYTYISVSCIKGKNGWKITNAIDKGNFFYNSPLYTRRIIGQIGWTLLKTIVGETPHLEIFQTVKNGFDFLGTISKEDVGDFEILQVLRILYHLGYVHKDKNLEIFLNRTDDWNLEILRQVNQYKINIIKSINKAFHESQM